MFFNLKMSSAFPKGRNIKIAYGIAKHYVARW